jgi:thiamine pyrophosphokinase
MTLGACMTALMFDSARQEERQQIKQEQAAQAAHTERESTDA